MPRGRDGGVKGVEPVPCPEAAAGSTWEGTLPGGPRKLGVPTPASGLKSLWSVKHQCLHKQEEDADGGLSSIFQGRDWMLLCSLNPPDPHPGDSSSRPPGSADLY